MILKKRNIVIVLAGLALGILGIIKLATIEDNIVPFAKLIEEYPYISTTEEIDSEVAEIYCPPRTRCPGLIITVKFANEEKRAIQAHYDVSDSVKFASVLTVGTRIVKHAGSDTLHLYVASDKTEYNFVIDRTL